MIFCEPTGEMSHRTNGQLKERQASPQGDTGQEPFAYLGQKPQQER